jgi:hypothetical protein
MASSTGKKDKGNKEQRKKPKLSIKEKRKQKNEKKNKSALPPPPLAPPPNSTPEFQLACKLFMSNFGEAGWGLQSYLTGPLGQCL